MKDPEDEAFEELTLKQGQWEHTSGWRKKQILETSMTQDEIFNMAVKCYLISTGNREGFYGDALIQFAKLVAEKALKDHAMQEVQRLGQEIEQEPVAWFHPHKGFYWAKPTSISAPTIADVEPLPLYTHPPKETK